MAAKVNSAPGVHCREAAISGKKGLESGFVTIIYAAQKFFLFNVEYPVEWYYG
jgi:hypothetical protein